MILGAVLGVIFAASSVYLALKIGLTVSASIPIAVLSVAFFRTLGKSTILENNIVQTTGSAGESIAAGVVFTLPAILLMGYDLTVSKVAVIAVIGGLLGILMMIPLRRALIVKEHGNLTYPEGTACAEVLVAGEKGGLQARLLFQAFGLAFVYKFLMAGLQAVEGVSRPGIHSSTTGASISAEVSPELLGVGYIIGPRIAGYLFAGGSLAYLVLIPAIKLFGSGLTQPIFAETKLIKDMSPERGPGRVRLLHRRRRGGLGGNHRPAPGTADHRRRVSVGLSGPQGQRWEMRPDGSGPTSTCRSGLPSQARSPWPLILTVLPQVGVNLLGAVLIIIFGFFFVVVSSRITGEIGVSANPISGMTIAALIGTATIFYLIGWTGVDYRVAAISIAGRDRRVRRAGRHHQPGPEDRLSGRIHTEAAADRDHGGRHDLGARNRLDHLPAQHHLHQRGPRASSRGDAAGRGAGIRGPLGDQPGRADAARRPASGTSSA